MRTLGALNNCSLNSALPVIISRIAYFAESEKAGSLAAGFAKENSAVYQKYLRLKSIFADFYGLKNDSLDWQHLHEFLQVQLKHNFEAAQIVFAPILRRFVDESAEFQLKEDYEEGQLMALSDATGRYLPLTIREANKYLYAPLGIQGQAGYMADSTEYFYPTHATGDVIQMRHTEEQTQAHFTIEDYSCQCPVVALDESMPEHGFETLVQIRTQLTSADEGQALRTIENIERLSDEAFSSALSRLSASEDSTAETDKAEGLKQATITGLQSLKSYVHQCFDASLQDDLSLRVKEETIADPSSDFVIHGTAEVQSTAMHLYESDLTKVSVPRELTHNEMQIIKASTAKIKASPEADYANAQKDYRQSLAAMVGHFSTLFADVDELDSPDVKESKTRQKYGDSAYVSVETQIKEDEAFAKALQAAEFQKFNVSK